jgi:hypothetical protein
MQIETLLPPGQAVFVTVFKITPKSRARNAASAATRLQHQIDGLGHQHPRPYRKPMLSSSRQILLAIENVHFTQVDADANSLSWAWQIAHQAGCLSSNGTPKWSRLIS